LDKSRICAFDCFGFSLETYHTDCDPDQYVNPKAEERVGGKRGGGFWGGDNIFSPTRK
jgi:hypothetical protein